MVQWFAKHKVTMKLETPVDDCKKLSYMSLNFVEDNEYGGRISHQPTISRLVATMQWSRTDKPYRRLSAYSSVLINGWMHREFCREIRKFLNYYVSQNNRMYETDEEWMASLHCIHTDYELADLYYNFDGAYGKLSAPKLHMSENANKVEQSSDQEIFDHSLTQDFNSLSDFFDLIANQTAERILPGFSQALQRVRANTIDRMTDRITEEQVNQRVQEAVAAERARLEGELNIARGIQTLADEAAITDTYDEVVGTPEYVHPEVDRSSADQVVQSLRQISGVINDYLKNIDGLATMLTKREFDRFLCSLYMYAADVGTSQRQNHTANVRVRGHKFPISLAINHCVPTFRHFIRAKADKVSQVVVKRGKMTLWGQKRGCPISFLRVAFDCADVMSDLNEPESEIVRQMKDVAVSEAEEIHINPPMSTSTSEHSPNRSRPQRRQKTE